MKNNEWWDAGVVMHLGQSADHYLLLQ